MILAWLLLVTGLTISAVAIYYSVIGLAAIFAAATIPIYIMGGSLEVAKIVCASWLKANWSRVPLLMKWYMTTAVVVLMIITSMGIFGFLSKAHSDQNLVSGEVLSKIAIYDEKIKTAKENIDANRKALKQMDEAVDQVMARSSSETGADKAVALRRAQLKERARLQSEIQAEQKAIVALNEERAPIAAQVRQVEAKVGPVKYIAALIYGDNPDANILEKAVTWVIIVIVSVFDPLAIIMLLAAQMTFQWIREKKKAEGDSPEKESDIVSTATVTEQPDLADEANALIAEIEREPAEFIPPEEPKKPDFDSSKHPYLYTGFSSFKDLKPMVYKPESEKVEDKKEIVPEPVVDKPDTIPDVERPGDYLILPELSEESKKKVYDKAQGSTDSQDQAITYVQNSEQNEETLWQRLQRKKDELKPIDRLYKEYSRDEFKGLETANLEPELFDFIEQTKARGPRFNNYNSEKLEYFARRIYELRKD
jgi:Txe/YoeB family toxin of Txe-Axe toxin-antitoxin module